MKITLLILLSSCILHPSAFPQGSLTPPGAPAPTMKTLDQIEARTPISSAPFTISASGSYYLTKNLNVTTGNAITINADGVTLDLNGFTISSTDPSNDGAAISLGSGRKDIAIANGHIVSGVTNSGGTYSGSGFSYGILAGASSNMRVSSVSVSGCLLNGIDSDLFNSRSTVVESCTVKTVGDDGISAQSVYNSAATDCGRAGIYCYTASNCYGQSVSTTYGLYGIYGYATVSNCFGQGASGQGISAKSAANCRGFSDTSQGIFAETASNCYGESNSNRGIFANVAILCSGRCVIGGSYGVYATSVANTCYGFSASGIGLHFGGIGAMCYGSRGSPAASASVLGGGSAGPIDLP
jgi:hypothetical protein